MGLGLVVRVAEQHLPRLLACGHVVPRLVRVRVRARVWVRTRVRLRVRVRVRLRVQLVSVHISCGGAPVSSASA